MSMTLATAAPIVVRRSRPVNTGGVPPVADEMTVGHHILRGHGTGTVLVIGTTEEMIHGKIQGTQALMKLSIHGQYLFHMSASCPSVLHVYHRILENPSPSIPRFSVVS